MEGWKETYRWWWEFLKRSEDYKMLCDWSVLVLKDEQNRLSLEVFDMGDEDFVLDELPPVIDMWIDTMVEKWICQEDNENFPCPHYRFNKKDKSYNMLYGYFPVFGNIYLEAFEDFWRKFRQDQPAYFGSRKPFSDEEDVVEGWEAVAHLWNRVENIMSQGEGGEPVEIEKFKRMFINWMKIIRPSELYVRINTQHGTIKEIAKKVEIIVRKYRRTAQANAAISLEKNYRFPTRRFVNEPFQRYLSVFDLWGQADIKTIVETVYPGTNRDTTENFDSLVSMTIRDYENAKRIIANVERGKFPGNYKSAK